MVKVRNREMVREKTRYIYIYRKIEEDNERE